MASLDHMVNIKNTSNGAILMDPRRSAVIETQSCIKKGQLAEAHSLIEKVLCMKEGLDQPAEEKIRQLKFLIETHVFAG